MAAEPDKQAIYEAMEACRPGSQDLSDPGLGFLAQALAEDAALAARYRWVQAMDRQVAAAFADVVVPEGLEARILQHLQTALAGSPRPENGPATGGEESLEAEYPWLKTGLGAEGGIQSQGVPSSEEGGVEGGVSLPTGAGETEGQETGQSREYTQIASSGESKETSIPHPADSKKSYSRRWANRRWVLVGGLAAAAAAGLLLFFWPTEAPRPVSLAQIQAEALQFAMAEPGEVFGSGQVWVGQAGQPPLPFSRAVWVPGYPRGGAVIRFREVAGLLGRDGLAYDLRSAEGICATLYVVPIRQPGAVPIQEGLSAEPPRYEQTARTGGYCAAAWQENGYLYMLVVHGDSVRAYYHFFRPQVVT